nr:transposase [Sinorhizobium sp. BJ1]
MGLHLRRRLPGARRLCRPRPAKGNTDALSLHLAEIGRQVAAGAHAVLVLDGAGWHCAEDLIIPDNLTLLHLPPYAPELNPVENIWESLRKNKLAITVFDGYDDIVDKCYQSWNFFANDKSVVASITSRKWAQVKR